MRKRKRYCEYWKKRLNYDYKEEYSIYKYLCGGMKHKRQEKKISEDRRFEAYSAWKEYVITCYETADLEKLKEFHKYLNMCSRVEKSEKGMSNTLFLPLYSAFATLLLTKIDWTDMVTVSKEFADKMIEYGWDLGGIMSVLFAIWISIVIVFGLLILVPIFFMVLQMLKAAISEGEIEVFYNDYMEIINEVIRQKSHN